MKKSFLIFVMFFMWNLFSAQKNFLDQPYIEVSASVDTLVVVDVCSPYPTGTLAGIYLFVDVYPLHFLYRVDGSTPIYEGERRRTNEIYNTGFGHHCWNTVSN